MHKKTSTPKTLRANTPEVGALVARPASEVSTPKPPPQSKGAIQKLDSGQVQVTATHTLDYLLANLPALTGTKYSEVAIRIAGQVAEALEVPKGTDLDSLFIQAISMIAEWAPQNAMEAMLIAQIIATQETYPPHEEALCFR